MFNNTKLARICVIEIRSDELFGVNDDPVLVKISIKYPRITKVHEAKLNVSDTKEMKKALITCGVPER